MSSAIGWLPPSLLTLVLWGVAVFLPKLAVRTMAPLHLTVYSAFFSLLSSVALLAFFGFRLDFQLMGAAVAVLIGVMGMSGWILYVFSLQRGSANGAVALTSLYPAIAALLAYAVLDERLRGVQVAGIALGTAALALLVLAGEAGRGKSAGMEGGARWAWPALGAMLLWGVWGFLPKIAVQALPPPSVVFYESVGSLCVALPVMLFLRGRLERSPQGIALMACTSIVSTVAILCYFLALRTGPVGTIVTLTAMYPVVSLLLARVLLKESINRRQGFAIILAMAALYLLSD